MKNGRSLGNAAGKKKKKKKRNQIMRSHAGKSSERKNKSIQVLGFDNASRISGTEKHSIPQLPHLS
jgi:hypothetical protein